MTARHRTLDLLAHRLDRAANTVPDALDHLDEQRAHVPILAAQDTTRPTASGGITNPVLAAILQLDPIQRHNKRIDDSIAALETWVAMLERAVQHARTYRYGQPDDDLAHLADNPRCMEPGCNQVPSRRTGRDGGIIEDGRCLDCGQHHDSTEARRRMDAEQARRVRRLSRFGTA